MDKTIRYIGAAVVIVAAIAVAYALAPALLQSPALGPVAPGTGAGNPLTVYFFYGEECPHCHVVMPLITNLSAKYPDAHIQILEVWHNQTNSDLYDEVNRQLKRSSPGVPEAVIGDIVLVGSREIPEKLEQLIIERLRK
jgi:thiol-disulfide isomerase/thioredoxin